jgi:preprotein translocase subunit SecE
MSAEEAVEEIEEKSRRRREDDDLDDSERGLTDRKGRATRSRRQTEVVVKRGFLGRIWDGTRGYIKGVSDELDKVVWPTREETIRLSRIILIVTIASALVLGLISFAFTELFVIGIREGKPIVFLIFGIAVVAVVFGYRWYDNRRHLNTTYR